MDKALIEYLLNIIIVVPVILCLIVISLKVSKKGIDSVSMRSYVQVIERFNLNKDTTLSVLKMGNTGCVLISSVHNTQVIKELDESEIAEIIQMKKEKNSTVNLSKIYGLDIKKLLNNKFAREKDDGHTKGNFN